MLMATAVTVYAGISSSSDVYKNGVYDNIEELADLPIQEGSSKNELPLGSLVITNSTADDHLLAEAIFAVYCAGENTRHAEVTVDSMGRTQEIPLPQGNYDIINLIPALGHAIADVVSVTITAGQRQELTIFSLPIQKTPTPEPTPQTFPPPIDTGRLLITLRAQDTGQLLGGAVYELRKAIDGEFLAYLITDRFGEAAMDLPTGDYFLRETQAVEGFIPNPDRVNVRIAANRVNEVDLTSLPEPVPTITPIPTVTPTSTPIPTPTSMPMPTPTSTPIPTPTSEPAPSPSQQPTNPEPGRLIVTVRADGTRELLQGARFEVRRSMDNHLVAELVTDRFGEAMVSLPPNDYFVRQITGTYGYEFDSERVNVRIAAGEIREVSITNRQTVPTTPPEQETPPNEAHKGRLLITVVSSETGERLAGAVYTVHDVMTDEIIITISSNEHGEASVNLPPGQYYKRNAAMPQGYIRDVARMNFNINAISVTTMNVTARAIPRPTTEPISTLPAQSSQWQNISVTPQSETPNSQAQSQNRVEIITRAEQSGSPLNGAAFSIYRASDNQLVGEITTDANGRAEISLAQGDYYLRNNSVQFGYLLEKARIFFTVVASGEVTVEVTIQRDPNIPDADVGNIVLPQTGELPPIMNYLLGTLFSVAALLCGIGLLIPRKSKRDRRRGIKDYA